MADVYSTNKYLDLTGLTYFYNQIKAGFMSTEEHSKLAGIEANANNYSLPTATASELGGVKIGDGVTITNGVISVSTDYDASGAATAVQSALLGTNQDTATDNTIYGLRAAITDAIAGLDASDAAVTGKYVSAVGVTNGELVITRDDLPAAYVLPEATASTLGGVKSGTNVDVANDGTISVKTASSSDLGLVKVGSNIGVDANGVISVAAASASAAGVMSAADFSKLAEFGAASTYALKSDITNAYIYKGTVAGVANLPVSGNTAGDVYNVTADGMNYAWTGTEWDALGSTFEVTSISNAEIDTIVAGA